VSELITPSAKTAKMLAAYYWPERDLDAEREAANRLRRETLADIGALFSAFPELNSISVSGYTPGWNDGDPCHHSQLDPYLNGRNIDDDEDDDDEDDDNEDDDEGERSSTRLSDKDFEAISHIIEGMSDVLEEIFSTNWTLIFRRTQNGIEFNRYDYDCGH
jgi:hypothetical protein